MTRTRLVSFSDAARAATSALRVLGLFAMAAGCAAQPSEPMGSGTSALAARDVVREMHVVFAPEDDCTQNYSPTVARDGAGGYHMWTGGWRSCAERADGKDKIFHATSGDLAAWTFDDAPVIHGELHYNDPSVVVIDDPGQPGRSVFLMFMTGCGPDSDCFAVGGNQTYGAVSFDGRTWSKPQLAIGRNNGITDGGAWSPSAMIAEDGRVYLYFHDSYGTVIRSTIDTRHDLFTPVAGETRRVIGGFHVNVDVTRGARGYEMLFDAGDPFRIGRLVSTNGLDFVPDETFAGIDGSNVSARALTGHAFRTSENAYWLFFGWGPCTSNTGCEGSATSIQGWRFERP